MTQTDYNDIPKKAKIKTGLAWFGLLALLFAIMGTYQILKVFSSHEITVERQDPSLLRKAAVLIPFRDDATDDKNYALPSKESDRLDILLLGIRGKDDVENGGLLTDTILLFSYDKKTGKSSLISIPRDLYVKIATETIDKINSAFERLGLTETKRLFSRITGVYVDHIAVLDFLAFKEIVDAVGGIDVTLEIPFTETQQWGYEFSLPAGVNHMDGQTALYYVRSRYSSNDFDRAARQQKVILALKEKILATNFISDPAKALALISAVRKNIQTDIDILNMKTLFDLAGQVTSSESALKRHVISTDNLLYDTKTPEGMYVLLPKGDNLMQIKDFFQETLK